MSLKIHKIRKKVLIFDIVETIKGMKLKFMAISDLTNDKFYHI